MCMKLLTGCGTNGFAEPRKQRCRSCASVLRTQVLTDVNGVERKNVADLPAVGVDESDRLARAHIYRTTLTRRNGSDHHSVPRGD